MGKESNFFCLYLVLVLKLFSNFFLNKCIIIFRFPNLKFEYKDPEKNFDRSKVSGLVCKLFNVKDPIHSTALEVTAGGKVSCKFQYIFNLVDYDQLETLPYLLFSRKTTFPLLEKVFLSACSRGRLVFLLTYSNACLHSSNVITIRK